MLTATVIKLTLFIIFVFLSMFFSSTETALSGLSKFQIKELIQKKQKSAELLKQWLGNPNRLLTGILIGNNFVNICASALATSLAIDFARSRGWSQDLAVGVTAGIVTFLVLVFGEIVPKTFAREHSQRVALKVIRPLLNFVYIFSPIIKTLLWISNLLVRAPGGGRIKEVPILTEEEIKTLIKIGQEEGALEKEEGKMLDSVLKFGDTKVREVMVPRIAMHCVDIKDGTPTNIKKIIGWGHSRVPVYEDNLDNIVGILYVKDFVKSQDGQIRDLTRILRAPYFVPETKRISELFQEFRKGREHLAVVVDEYGIMVGLITLEDLVEEITGEILDEYDVKEETIKVISDKEAIVNAKEDIDKVNEQLQLNLPGGEFESVGGLVLDLFGRVPRPGEKKKFKGIRITVLEATRRRVRRIKIEKIT